jgi:hypothetical protein
VSIETLASAKYCSHCLNQLNGSSPEKVEKSSFGLEIDRVNWLAWVCGAEWLV